MPVSRAEPSSPENVTQAKPRDRFVELLSKHRRRLFGYSFALVHHMADAEDVFQQCCTILWRKFDSFDAESPTAEDDFVAWANQTARFVAMNFLRSKRRSRVCFSEEFLNEAASLPEQADDESDEERREALRYCLKKLRESDQQLIRLCYGGKQTIKEVAQQLGRSPESVYVSVGRIRHQLYEGIRRRLNAE